jgi:ubiquinone/menaquinone biosynthesis C-methylase UbiE
MYVFRNHVRKDASVLELGAGAGIFTKELAGLAGELTVSDISEEQLAINRARMKDMGVEERVHEFRMLDITDLRGMEDDRFDIVICVGGALNYTFDREQAAITEMLRVTRPGGILILGSVALFSSLMRYLPAIAEEKQDFGIEATRWLMKTGIQDAEHYPVANKNYLHMMTGAELDARFEGHNIEFVERRAAGIFSLAGDAALEQAKADRELWDLILEKELEFSKNSAYLNCGANLIYVVKKM